MADNIVKRIVQMILDKDSAKKVQSDANDMAKGIDDTWKSLGKKIAGYLAVGFLLDKVVAFGKASVAEAMASQKVWSELKNTIDNTGESFDAMEKDVRAAADAFQDATIHDDDAFAGSLNRMIALTGDVSASLNNMGLVANVAAKFFGGDLEAATNVVAKAMNGNTNALRKMGITATDAQSALEILAQRSMGAATAEAQTFAGQLKQLDEVWNDVLKTTGEAIISSDGSTDALNVLRAALGALSDWLVDNKDKVRDWVTNGIKFAIDAADLFIRAVMGMGNILTGGFLAAIGLASVGIGKLIGAWASLRETEDSIRKALGEDVTEREKLTKSIRDNATALEEWGKAKFNAGVDANARGMDFLSKPLFNSDDFSGKRKTPELKVNKPMVGSNVSTDESEAVAKALKQFRDDGKAAEAMARTLGESFDSTGAEIERTTKLLNALTSNGVDPASVGMGDLGARLKDLITNVKPTEDAMKELAKSFDEGVAMAAIKATSSIDQLKQQQNDILTTIQNLISNGIDPQAKVITDLTGRYDELTEAIKEAADIQHVADAYRGLGDEIRQNLFMATLDGANSLDKMKIKQQALQKAMQTLLSQGIKPQSKELQELAAQYRDVTVAIEDQTRVMEMQSAAADFLAEALGTALQGGLHEAASAKAKQNAIEAAEMLVRAGAFALFGDFGHASAALALAGQFAGIAAAWGVLAAASSGGGGGGAVSVPTSGGGGGGITPAGSDLGSSRESSNDAASRAQQPSAEVSVYLVGPGFDALNPEVQRVVWGAQQQADERYGPNARIRVGPNR